MYESSRMMTIAQLKESHLIRTMLSWSIRISSFVLLLCLGLIVWRIWNTYPCNHWGVIDIRYGVLLCLLNMAVSALGISWYGKTNLFITGIAIGVMSMMLLLVIDQLNLLVEYELWVRRGLPDMWEWRRELK